MTFPDDEIMLTRAQAAAFLSARGFPTAPATLAKLATAKVGGGPAFIKYGSRPLYQPSELVGWARQRRPGAVA